MSAFHRLVRILVFGVLLAFIVGVPAAYAVCADPALEAAVQAQMIAEGRTRADIRGLWCNAQGVTTLAGLEDCVSLRNLSLTDNNIADITAVASMPLLRTLDLRNNNVTDITAVGACPLLMTINLNNNGLEDGDLAPLSSCTGLQYADVAYNYLGYPAIGDLAALIADVVPRPGQVGYLPQNGSPIPPGGIPIPAGNNVGQSLPNGGYVQFPSTNGGWFTFNDQPTLEDCVQWILVGGGYVLTVDFPFTGRAILTLPYPESLPDIDAQTLAIMHFTSSGWVNITTGVNTSAHTVTGETTFFSDFGVFMPEAAPPEPVATPASSAWSLAALAVLGLGAVPVVRRMKASA